MLLDRWTDFARDGSWRHGLSCAGCDPEGQRQAVGKMDAFDLGLTVALGSTLATTLLSKDISWAEGLAGCLLLVLLRRAVENLAKSQPGTLLIDGVVDERVLARTCDAGRKFFQLSPAPPLATSGQSRRWCWKQRHLQRHRLRIAQARDRRCR